MDLVRLKPNPWTSSFSALTLLVGSFDPYKPVPDMTYNVFSGMLNLTQSIKSCQHQAKVAWLNLENILSAHLTMSTLDCVVCFSILFHSCNFHIQLTITVVRCSSARVQSYYECCWYRLYIYLFSASVCVISSSVDWVKWLKCHSIHTSVHKFTFLTRFQWSLVCG